MNEEIYRTLVEVAKAGELITYGEVAPLANLNMENPYDRNLMSVLLDEINVSEAHFKRPMLSSVVVRAQEPTPGKGYFLCARDLGRLPQSADSIDELEFWTKEIKIVFSYWKISN